MKIDDILVYNENNSENKEGNMNNFTTPIIRGFDYQARVFWKYVNSMLLSGSKIDSICYEFRYKGIRAFDDVVVIYNEEKEYRGKKYIKRDLIQVKYHCANDKVITAEALFIPKFVNGIKYSFIDNVLRAYKNHTKEFMESRFILFTTAPIKETDILAQLIDTENESFNLEKLFTQNRAMETFRKKMIAQLKKYEIAEEKLCDILGQVCICAGKRVSDLEDELRRGFVNNGLNANEDYLDRYISIVQGWAKDRKTKFIKSDDILRRCREKELLMSDCAVETIVVRSLGSDAHKSEESTATYLNLMTYFNGRELGTKWTWEDLYKVVTVFVKDNMSTQKNYYLDMPAHYSVVFMLGRVLNQAEGFSCMPAVRAAVDSDFEDLGKEKDEQEFKIGDEILDKSASDVALAISITHNISSNVKEYITENRLKIRRMIMCEMPNCSENAAKSGSHIKNLSDQLGEAIDQRSIKEKEGIMHIFVSAPKEIMFWLGKKSRTYGRIQLYEYNNVSIYAPSVAFPIGKPENPDRENNLDK